MDEMDTDPDISMAILHSLKTWHSNTNIGYEVPFFLQDATDEQTIIGWNLFLEQWIAIEWEMIQQAYYNLIKSWRMGKRWLISIIKKLCQAAWDLWDHRNKVLHEKENTVMQLQVRQLESQILSTYWCLSTFVVEGADRYLTRLSLPLLLDKEMEYKKAWFMQASTILKILRQSSWRGWQTQQVALAGMRRITTL